MSAYSKLYRPDILYLGPSPLTELWLLVIQNTLQGPLMFHMEEKKNRLLSTILEEC